jgi:hypothetical protein
VFGAPGSSPFCCAQFFSRTPRQERPESFSVPAPLIFDRVHSQCMPKAFVLCFISSVKDFSIQWKSSRKCFSLAFVSSHAAGIVLELMDQRLKFFWVLILLLW